MIPGGCEHLRTVALGLSAVTVQQEEARLAGQQGLGHVEIVLALKAAEFKGMMGGVGPQVLVRGLVGSFDSHYKGRNRAHLYHILLCSRLVGRLPGREHHFERTAVGAGRDAELPA